MPILGTWDSIIQPAHGRQEAYHETYEGLPERRDFLAIRRMERWTIEKEQCANQYPGTFQIVSLTVYLIPDSISRVNSR